MKTNKKAVSLIVLVVTILVLAILVAAAIISLSKGDIMGQASKTVFKQDMANYKEAYELYVTEETIRDITFERDTLNITYEDEKYEKIFGNVPDKYKEGLKVVNGKLVYKTEDKAEKAVLEELAIASSIVIGNEIVIENGVERSKYIGYFADVDGDNEVDGVIFADLAHTVSGKQWYDSDGEFSYTATSGFKKYEITKESYSVTDAEGYGSKPVLKATGSGEDRFYVMSLSDFTTSDYTTFYWYESLSGNANASRTSSDFGSGKQNTVNIVLDWNRDTSSNKNTTRDMWGVIQKKVYGADYSYTEGEVAKIESDVEWFVPSKAEWSAFCYAFSLTTLNYGDFGLSNWYLSSSIYDSDYVWNVPFTRGNMNGNFLNVGNYIRLATTF